MTLPLAENISIDKGVALKLEARTDRDATDVCRLLKKNLPAGTRVRLTTVGLPELFFVQISYKDPQQPGRAFSFTRSINLNKRHAYHAEAQVSDIMHKEGTARIVNQNMIAFYRQIGIKTVSTNATKIGVYAWARMGFIPYIEEWQAMRGVIARRLDYLEGNPPEEGPIPLKVVDELRRLLASDNPRSFWRIVDNATPCDRETLGRVLTLEDHVLCNRVYGPAFEELKWAGALHLEDQECMARLQSSTGICPPPYRRPAIRLR